MAESLRPLYQGQMPTSADNRVRWELLEPQGLPALEMALMTWDACLEMAGCTWEAPRANSESLEKGDSTSSRFLPTLTCICRLISASPEPTFTALASALPMDEQDSPQSAILVRLLSSFSYCNVLGEEARRSAVPLILRSISELISVSSEELGYGEAEPRYVTLFKLLEGQPHRRFRHHNGLELVAMLADINVHEQGAGSYPATLAALTLFRSLFEVCSPERLILPWDLHTVLSCLEGSTPSVFEGKGAQAEQTEKISSSSSPLLTDRIPRRDLVTSILNLVFSVCFAKCSYWPSRLASDRLMVQLTCLKIAQSLVPTLECFNWPCPGATGDVVAKLRQLQHIILASWSESTFIPALLQLISCELWLGGSGSSSTSPGPAIEFRSPANELLDLPTSGAGEEDYYDSDNINPPKNLDLATGKGLVLEALKVLHGVLALGIKPTGFAQEQAPLIRHLVDITSARAPQTVLTAATATTTATAAEGGEKTSAQQVIRANLVQSLFSHLSDESEGLQEWSLKVLTSLCALWNLASQPMSPLTAASVVQGGHALPPFLSFLTLPSISPQEQATMDSSRTPWPTSLADRLANRLLHLLSDPTLPVGVRCAASDLARATLDAAPAMFAGVEAGMEKLVEAACKALVTLLDGMNTFDALMEVQEVSQEEMEVLVARWLLSLLGLLYTATARKVAVAHLKFQTDIKGNDRSFSTLWDVLAAVVRDVLLPWTQTGQPPWCQSKGETIELVAPTELLLARAAVYRLTERGFDSIVSGTTPDGSFTTFVHQLWGEPYSVLWAAQAGPGKDASNIAETTNMDEDGPRGGRRKRQKEDEDVSNSPATTVSRGPSKGFSLFEQQSLVQQRLKALVSKHKLDAQVVPSPDGHIPEFRGWEEVFELGTGVASRPLPQGRELYRESLETMRLGSFGCTSGAASVHSGSSAVDDFASQARLVETHRQTLLFVLGSVGCKAGDSISDAIFADLAEIYALKQELDMLQSFHAAQVVTMEAFSDQVHAGSRLLSRPGALRDVLPTALAGLIPMLLRQLGNLMESPNLLSYSAASLARTLRLTSHLLTLPPFSACLLAASSSSSSCSSSSSSSSAAAAAAKAKVLTPFSCGQKGLSELASVKELLQRETPPGTSLVMQLVSTLKAACSELVGRADLIPRSGEATSLVDASLRDTVLHALSLLNVLLPALRQGPKQGGDDTEMLDILSGDVLQVLSLVLEALNKCENSRTSTNRSPPSAAGVQGATNLAVDCLLGSGFLRIVMTSVEQVVLASINRSPDRLIGKSVIAVLQRHLLPQVLSSSNSAFAPIGTLNRRGRGDARQTAVKGQYFASAAATFGYQMPTMTGDRSFGSSDDRTFEASWASRLDAILEMLLAVARTTEGAVLLAEGEVLLLLAHCPLLHAAVLPAEGSVNIPPAYTWPSHGAAAAAGSRSGAVPLEQGFGIPWRRPLHSTWCRSLLLVSSILSATPHLVPQAELFLRAYAPRFRHVLINGLQSGHLAALEEGTLVARLLSLMASGSPLAQSVLVDCSAASLAFLVGSCLSERGTPSEIFAPLTDVERAAGRVPGESEACPAQVPSIFHQRCQYLALILFQSLLLALLRIAASPAWLNSTPLGSWQAASVAGTASAWPGGPSLFGLQAPGSTGAAAAGLGSQDRQGGPMRQWAAVMDASLEGARRVVELLEVLRRRQFAEYLVIDQSKGEDAILPLCLSLLPVNLSGGGSPGVGGLGLLSRSVGSPQSSAAMSCEYVILQPFAACGGQQVLGIAPECVAVSEIEGLCGSIVEMACTLLSHFCQATWSSILTGADRSTPGSSVLHGLLSFLHELLSSTSLQTERSEGDSPSMLVYLADLDAALRAWQNLGTAEESLEDEVLYDQ